jgi:hypothetical protein
MDHSHSSPLTTSQGPVFVRRCACGGVHLCIGGVSINLAKEAAVFLTEEFARVTKGWREESAANEALATPRVLKMAFSSETN